MEDVWAFISHPATAGEGLRILRARVADQPSDPKPLFDLASAYDMLDREVEAEQAYRQVRCLGIERLPFEDRSRWFIQAGSTLRLLGRIEESRKLLAEGEAAFPKNLALAAFRALTELEAGSPENAARVLLYAILQSPDAEVGFYRPALARYARELLGPS